MAFLVQDVRHALDVIEPVLAGRLGAKGVAGNAVGGSLLIAPYAHGPILPRRDLDARPLRNRHGQDKAAVVIRMLADQVHAAGSIGSHRRSTAEQGLKVSHVIHAMRRAARWRWARPASGRFETAAREAEK